MTFHVETSKALKKKLSYYHAIKDENLVLNQTARFIQGQVLLACFFLNPMLVNRVRSGFFLRHIKIADVKNYSSDEQRDIFNTFEMEDQKDKDIPIDPFDLMNRIKRAGAMNDATTPSDALDEALNAFDESEY